jgi:protoheme IX farnesyltransferase
MLWYTAILLPVSILPYVFGALGPAYLALATVLGLAFLVDVLRVTRGGAAEWTKSAWRLYKFSLLYLALLFAAMVVDRVIYPIA